MGNYTCPIHKSDYESQEALDAHFEYFHPNDNLEKLKNSNTENKEEDNNG